MIKLTKGQIEKLIEIGAIDSFDSLNYTDKDCIICVWFWANDLEEGECLFEQLFSGEEVNYLESCGISDDLIYDMYAKNDYTKSSEISNDEFCPTCIFEIEFEYLGDIKFEGFEVSGFNAPNQLLLF